MSFCLRGDCEMSQSLLCSSDIQDNGPYFCAQPKSSSKCSLNVCTGGVFFLLAAGRNGRLHHCGSEESSLEVPSLKSMKKISAGKVPVLL